MTNEVTGKLPPTSDLLVRSVSAVNIFMDPGFMIVEDWKVIVIVFTKSTPDVTNKNTTETGNVNFKFLFYGKQAVEDVQGSSQH